jgi:hypothetical protein
VLAPGGLLTVATIDLMKIVENRYKKLPNPASWISAMYGDSWGLERPFVAHRCCFDEAILTRLMLDAGFSSVRTWEPSQYPEIAALWDCASRDRDVSLLLEGVA